MLKPQLLILAGGVGKRMWPLTTGKPLFSFAGKPLIAYLLSDWQKAGLSDFKVVSSPTSLNSLRNCFKKYFKKIKPEFFVQEKPLGMGKAVLAAKLNKNRPLIIINGDDWFERKAYFNFLAQIKKNKPKILLSGFYTKTYFPGGYFKLKNKKIKGLIEKPKKQEKPSNYLNLVIHYFAEPLVFLNLLKLNFSDDDKLYEMALDQLIKKEPADLFIYKGEWQALKYPWQILSLMEKIFKFSKWESSISPRAKISPHAYLQGEIEIEDGVKIYEGAVIVGPAYIGKNTIIGHHSLIRESMIGENCVVGFGSEITRSWIGDNCWFHRNYIGDSVLEGDISFGAGALTANLRLDEKLIKIRKEKIINTERKKLGAIIGKGVRVGVNASLMPGTLVGGNSVIGPTVVFKGYLPENTSCFLKKENLKNKIKKK